MPMPTKRFARTARLSFSSAMNPELLISLSFNAAWSYGQLFGKTACHKVCHGENTCNQ